MQSTGLLGLQVGSITEITAPDDQAYTAVVIYNGSGTQLAVSWAGNSDTLEPLQAAQYRIPGSNSAISVLPISSYAVGCYIGCVSATWYLASDPQPTNYPLPLLAFAGGASPLLTPTPNAPSLTRPVNIGINNGSRNSSIQIAPPSGTGQITLAGFVYESGLVSNTLFSITGDQSNTVYFSSNDPIGNPDLIVTLYGGNDSTYTIAVTASGGYLCTASWNQIYASPGVNPLPIVDEAIGPADPNLEMGLYLATATDQFGPPPTGFCWRIWAIYPSPQSNADAFYLTFDPLIGSGSKAYLAFGGYGASYSNNPIIIPKTGLLLQPNTGILLSDVVGTNACAFLATFESYE